MNRTRLFRRFLLLAGLSLGLMGAGDAYAQARPPGPGKPVPAPTAPVSQRVSVEVMVVHATNAHSNVDPRLRSMLSHLQHLNYTGFEVLDVRTNDLSPGQETSFGIAGGRRLEVELLDRNDTQARMRVRMYSGSKGVLDTTVNIHRNRSFIVGGPQNEEGVLILPITARY